MIEELARAEETKMLETLVVVRVWTGNEAAANV